MASAARSLILVEGTDDQNFLNHILVSHGYQKKLPVIPGCFDVVKEGRPEEAAIRIHSCDGFAKIPDALKVAFRPDDLDGLAIVADMDRHDDMRWLSLRGTLASERYDLPNDLRRQGLVHVQPDLPSMGVWLMPDNAAEGMIETFAGKLVAPEDPGWLHARSVIADLPDTVRRFQERYNDKALLHTWLAWQEEPGCRTGTAVSRKLLRADQPAATQFVEWVERWLAASAGRRNARPQR
jgi:hypothetical protein